MAYLEFEKDRDLEMEFYIAEQLGLTVGRLRVEMSSQEFTRWAIYFARKAQRRQLSDE